MRITWWSSRGCGEYRLFLDYAEKGGRWADVRIDCGEARYLGGNAMSERERDEIEVLATEEAQKCAV